MKSYPQANAHFRILVTLLPLNTPFPSKTAISFCFTLLQIYSLQYIWTSIYRWCLCQPFFQNWKNNELLLINEVRSIGFSSNFFVQLKDGRLHTGDHILQIGGTNVQGMTSEQVAQVLRNCGNSVRMLIARDPVGEISVTPPTPIALPVALPAVANRSSSSVSIQIILSF